MRKNVLTSWLALTFLAGCAESPTVEGELAKAREFAGEDFAESLFICDPKSTKIADTLAKGIEQVEPTWAFDDLAFVGNTFVGVWVLRTDDGLILFDSGTSEADARDNIVPGLEVLGLDPADIRYVFITHGHWDHYGGAAYLKALSGGRIGLSEADWQMMAKLEPDDIARAPHFGGDQQDRPPPQRDFVVEDGQIIMLGDSEVTLLVTPGHSPGTLSALVPVRLGEEKHLMSLLGGTGFPRSMEPEGAMGGLLQFEQSVERLQRIGKEAGADGLINTHAFVDGSLEKLRKIAANDRNEANPFVLGAVNVERYYSMFLACLRAAKLRPMEPDSGPPMPSGEGEEEQT